MAVRWALEEVGQLYDVRLLTFAELKQPAHRSIQPFGQIPTYQDGSVALFESGAIVMHIADHNAGLLPSEAGARSRAVAWMFSAQATIEPPVVERSMAIMLESDKPWHKERLALLDDRVGQRLAELSRFLSDRDWLEGNFSAGDLLMATVLQRLEGSGMLEAQPNLAAYVLRAQARAPFKRAFAAQLAVFNARPSQT